MSKLKYIAYLLFFSLIMQSCLKDEKDIFDDSASVRMSKTLEKYQSILVGSEYGWALEYYPENNQQYGGYMYVISFTEEEATVGYELAGTGDRITSLYQLISDNGPVLTFDIYNEYMHHFAEPSQKQPDGLEGDYEFILLEGTEDVIPLKGKKTGNYMRLIKLKQSGESYLLDVEESSSLFSLNQFTINVKGEEFDASKENNNKRLSVTTEENSVSVAYVFTSNGIRLYEPMTLNGISIQTFAFSEDKTQLICIDEGVDDVYIGGPNPALFFVNEVSKQWEIDNTLPMGEKVSRVYDQIVEDCATILNERFTNLYFRYYAQQSTYALSFKSSSYTGTCYFTRELVDENTIKFNYTGNCDRTAQYYVDNIDSFKELLTLLSTEYTVFVDEAASLNLQQIGFKSVNDPNANYFYVSLK